MGLSASDGGRLEGLRRHRGDLTWMVVVAFIYVGAMLVTSRHSVSEVDRMMTLAGNMFGGRVDLGSVARPNDIVTIDGRNYQAFGLLPVVPYWLFVPFHGLWAISRWIIPAVLGTLAGWLALPLARRYGPGGNTDYLLASLGAFGTLLFTQSIAGNFYYLAQVEAMLLTFVALIEWQGRRRPWLIAASIGLAALARPTLLVAALPMGVVLLMDSKDRIRAAAAFLAPIGGALLLTGWWNYVRFGSPLETGYGLSSVSASLAQLRSQGIFSLSHLPANLALFVGGGFNIEQKLPYMAPSTAGHSILLTTPALLVAVGASIRNKTNLVLWAAAGAVAIPVFLYYGGGGADTYGYRYALDFTPFLLALVAAAAKERFGNLEKVLIALSIAFVSYGFVEAAFR